MAKGEIKERREKETDQDIDGEEGRQEGQKGESAFLKRLSGSPTQLVEQYPLWFKLLRPAR